VHQSTCTYRFKPEKEIAREADIGWRVREGPHRRLCCEDGSLCRDGSHSFIRSHHVLDPLRRELHQQRENNVAHANRQSNPTWRGSCVKTPQLPPSPGGRTFFRCGADFGFEGALFEGGCCVASVVREPTDCSTIFTNSFSQTPVTSSLFSLSLLLLLFSLPLFSPFSQAQSCSRPGHLHPQQLHAAAIS
jgi:hypothetical protein